MAPRKAATKKSAPDFDVPTIEGSVCFAFDLGKTKLDVIRRVTELVPDGTGESTPMVLLQTVDQGISLTYSHFGYGTTVVIPATNGGVVLNHAVPYETLAAMSSPTIVQMSLMTDGQTLNIRLGSVQVRVVADPPEMVERHIPDFLNECFDSFVLTDEQFSGLLKQVVFKSTDLSVKGTGLPVRIKSDREQSCYFVSARDSAFGIIKAISADIDADVDVTVSHQFLKVISDTLRVGDSVVFGFSDDMSSCKTSLGNGTIVWAPIPLFEEWDLLHWRNTTLEEETQAEFNAPFGGILGVLDTIVPHFKLDDQTNNVKISIDQTVSPENILVVFESSRVAVGGRAVCQVVKPMTEGEILTDGKRMAAFLKCGKGSEDLIANLKLFTNHLFVNIPEARLEFILPLR